MARRPALRLPSKRRLTTFARLLAEQPFNLPGSDKTFVHDCAHSFNLYRRARNR